MGAQPPNDSRVLTTFGDVNMALANADLTRNVEPDRFAHGNVLDGVLMVLDGSEHRDRRRVENALFRNKNLTLYERDLFPRDIERILDSLIRTKIDDLVQIGLMLSMTLSARTAGIDFDFESIDERRILGELNDLIGRGISIDAATGDIDAIKREALEAMAILDERFISPSWERRKRLLDAIDRGEASEDDLPRDVLTLLLQHQAELGLDDDTIRRETAFYLESGVITSSQTLTASFHYIFEWAAEHPREWRRRQKDRLFLQRCVHEAIRLLPVNPAISRRAIRDTQLGSRVLNADERLVLDTAAANRDPAIYGDNAAIFNPDRRVPPGIARYGHAFSGGVHSCIGRVLAVGLPIRFEGAPPREHLYGLVTLSVEALIARGIRPHPSMAPVSAEETRHWTQFRSYPITFDTGQSA